MYTHQPTQQLVEKEPYSWVAYYSDGGVLKQFDDQGYFHRSEEIDLSRLVCFKMVGERSSTLMFDSSMEELIFFYRNIILNALTPDEVRHRLYVYGFKRAGKPHYFVIMPGGEVVYTDDVDRVTVV